MSFITCGKYGLNGTGSDVLGSFGFCLLGLKPCLEDWQGFVQAWLDNRRNGTIVLEQRQERYLWPGANPLDYHRLYQPLGHILESSSGEQGFEVLFFFHSIGGTYQVAHRQKNGESCLFSAIFLKGSKTYSSSNT